jgi:hypothetical protein
VERHKDQPFAIVGVNTDRDKAQYRSKAEEFGVTWRSAWQGSTSGPIPMRWGVRGYPTIYLLDAEHKVRYVNVRGEALAEAVAKLLAETKTE